MDIISRKSTNTATAAAVASILLFSPTASASQSSSRRRARSTVAAARHDAGALLKNVPKTPMRRSDKHSDVSSLSPTFSCGSIWTEATQCSMLCPTGDGCPNGQECFAGIPCPSAMVKESEMLSRVELETELAEEQYESTFACGTSYASASEMCGSSSSALSLPSLLCPQGLSVECPSGMNCYAAVRCPREDLHSESSSSYNNEAILSSSQDRLSPKNSSQELISSYFDYEHFQVQNLSSYVTQPVLINATLEGDASSKISRVGSLAHGSCLL